MPDSGLATAADYSEALLTARRAKSAIALLLALMLIGQIAIFLLLKYRIVTLPSATTTGPSVRLLDLLHYLTGLMILGGIGLAIVLAFLLGLIGHVMLVGRLIGVGRVTSALIWCLVLIVFLFPWQALMNDALRVPGVLWTWDELLARYDFASSMSSEMMFDTVLSWFRFVGAPLVAVILILGIQFKSNRGLRMALGEDDVLNELMRGV